MGIYENIQRAAKSRGYTVSAIESALSLPRSSIAKYNAHVPSVDKIKQIASFLYNCGYHEIDTDLITIESAELLEDTSAKTVSCGFCTKTYFNINDASFFQVGIYRRTLITYQIL